MAAVGAQKLVHLFTLVGNVFIGRVHSVNDQQDVGGVLAAGDGLERREVAGSFVVEQGEVLLLEIADRRPGLGRHHNIEVDSGRRSRGRRSVLLGAKRRGTQERGANKQATTKVD